jgi:hypothetical protein
MAPTKEKLPIAANFDELQARIDLAIAKREAIVKSWVDKYDTSRCAPSKTKEEIAAWDAELFNPVPSNLGLGAAVPKEYLNGDLNRKDIAGNGRLRNLMLGKKGLQASKPRDAAEKAKSIKRGFQADSSDEDEGRSSLIKSKKTKREAAKLVAAKVSTPLPLQPKTAITKKCPVDDSDAEHSRTLSQPSKAASKAQDAKQTQCKADAVSPPASESSTATIQSDPNARAEDVPPVVVPTIPAAADTTSQAASAPESPAKTSAEIEARREKNRLKKQKQKEKKRREKEQALAAAGIIKDAPSEEQL